MKLFIQIPCLNEEKTLPQVIRDLPREIEGVDEIYTLCIDDGSVDNTVKVAQAIGIDFILKNPRNLGLAESFIRGIECCLFLGADIIVNTDGDNQYCGEDIPNLIRPILDRKADVVVGCRDIDGHAEFSMLKKHIQKIGSRTVSRLAKINIPDTTSGFRAFSRFAAMRLSVMNPFSYTLETLIQAGRTGFEVQWVPIRVNPSTRPSRLFRSMRHFVSRQMVAILKAYLFYCPIRLFGWLAFAALLVAFFAAARNVYYLWFVEPGFQVFKSGSGVLLLASFIVALICTICGLLGSVLSGLRFLLEDIRFRIRNISLCERIKSLHLDLLKAPVFFQWKQFMGLSALSGPDVEYMEVKYDQ